MDKIKIRLKKIPEGRILDFGTGVGNFISFLKEASINYKEIVGIDIREDALQKARQKFKDENIKFININGNRTKFEDNSFDVVCISNTLHHLEDIPEVLSEMMRVLKPKGIFIINEMYCDNLTEKQLSHVKLHHFQCEIDTILGICHNKTFNRNEIVDIAKRIGLKNIELFDYNTHDEQKNEESITVENEILNDIFLAIANKLEMIKQHKEYETYKELLEKYRSELYDIGFFTATELMIIGKK